MDFADSMMMSDDGSDMFLSSAPAENFESFRAVGGVHGHAFNFDLHATMQHSAIPMLSSSSFAPQKALQTVHANVKATSTPITILPSSSSSAQMESICRERPSFLTFHNFHPDQKDFEKLREIVNEAVQSLDEHIDSMFVSEDQLWKLKYFNGSDMRELVLWCYWDSKAQDHILEFKRIKGDGFLPSTHELFERLRCKVAPHKFSLEDVQEKKRTRCSAMPAAPLRRSHSTGSVPPPPPPLFGQSRGSGSSSFSPCSSSSALGLSCVSVSLEDVLHGLETMARMAQEPFVETRIEAARAICDYAKRDRVLLANSKCIRIIVDAIDKLLVDDHDDVRQFAVMACSQYVQIPAYMDELAKMNNLAALVCVAIADEAAALDWVMAKRVAAQTLAVLANGGIPRKNSSCQADSDGIEMFNKDFHNENDSHNKERAERLCWALRDAEVNSAAELKMLAESMKDARTKRSLSSIACCFSV